MIDKPRRIRRKTNFLCRFCKGYHLTRLCPTIAMVQEAWSFPRGPSGSESYLVSKHSNPSFFDIEVVLMQSLASTTLIFVGDAFLDHVFLHLVQLVIVSM
jgi:hypothetical protein